MIRVYGTFVHVYLLEHKIMMLLVYTVSEGRLWEEGLECVSGHCKKGFSEEVKGGGGGCCRTVHICEERTFMEVTFFLSLALPKTLFLFLFIFLN